MVLATPLFITLLPFLLAFLCGYVATRRRWMPSNTAVVLTRFVLYLALPALIIHALNGYDARQSIAAAFLAAHALTLALVVLTVLICVHQWFLKTRANAVMTAYAASYSNEGFLGFPLLLALFGHESIVPISLIFTFDLVVFTPLARILHQTH